MTRTINSLSLALILGLASPTLARAQTPRACQITGEISMAKLQACDDSLNAQFSRKMEQVNATLAQLELWRRDMQQAMADLAARIPLGGRSVSNDSIDIRDVPASLAADGSNALLALRATASAGSTILFRANTVHAQTQDGITGSYWAELGLNGWDGGFRLLQNSSGLGTPRLPYTIIGPDSHGAWSYSWYPRADGVKNGGAYDAASGTGSNYWPSLGAAQPYYVGQTLMIDGGSQLPYTYALAGDAGVPLSFKRHVLIASQRKGWPMYFTVSPNRVNNTPENWAVLKLNADGSPNPVEMVVDGALRRVQSCTLPNGIRALCY
jgi:hypothetical protein